MFTWLCTLCRREIGAWLERRGRSAEVSLVEDHPATRVALDAAASLASANPESEAERRRELSRLVQLTLDHLPGRYGQVLEWKYIQGLSVDEIAGTAGCRIQGRGVAADTGAGRVPRRVCRWWPEPGPSTPLAARRTGGT